MTFMIHSFPKIFQIGSDFISSIFEGTVSITEKIDGSQFSFGKIDGELYLRSKGQQLFPDNPEKMFSEAIEYVISIQDKIPDNTVYYSEYLKKPNHNILNYERVPKNNLIVFGVSDEKGNFKKDYEAIKKFADTVKLETVAKIYEGKIDNAEQLLKFLETESVLGKTKVEGIVVKNYFNPFLLGGQPIPIMMGKYVSEKFKEVHKEKWGRKFSSKGKWETFKESFKTEARWEKGIQHLRDNGKLENSPRDIGSLIKEIQRDIEEEEKENIKEFLWKEYDQEILRYSTRGFPEFYKEKLLKSNFKKGGE